ncbi:MAG TPA: hypothetical protein VEY51_19120 [Chondromyces sp.]|nr:hypothetical protein [Chondromyces sp.]
MRQAGKCVGLTVLLIISIFLYNMQLGSIPFLSLSIYLFFLAYKEIKSTTKVSYHEKPKQSVTSNQSAEKKAGIIT